MKIITLILLVALLAFSYVGPVSAQSDHAYLLGDTTIKDFRVCFKQAVEIGHVDNQGVARRIIDKHNEVQVGRDYYA